MFKKDVLGEVISRFLFFLIILYEEIDLDDKK